MIDLLKPYAKAAVAFGALLITGAVLVAVGQQEAGVALVTSAPVVSGLVIGVTNKPKGRRAG